MNHIVTRQDVNRMGETFRTSARYEMIGEERCLIKEAGCWTTVVLPDGLTLDFMGCKWPEILEVVGEQLRQPK